MLPTYIYKSLYFFLLITLLFLSSCKETPTFEATNPNDPKSQSFVPENPTQLSVSILDENHIKVDWSHQEYDTESLYLLERKTDNQDFKQIATVAGETIFTDSLKLIPGSRYSYRVKAKTAHNESEFVKSREVHFDLQQVNDLNIIGINADSVLVTWSNAASIESEFQISIKNFESSNNTNQVTDSIKTITVPKKTRSYYITDLDTAYYYIISVTPIIHDEYTLEFPSNGKISYQNDLFKLKDIFSLSSDMCCHIHSASFLDNNNSIVVGAADGSIKIIDPETGTIKRNMPTNGTFQYYIKSFDNGQKFISVSNSEITLRNVNGDVLYEINDKGGYINADLTDVRNKQLFAYILQDDNYIRIYDLKNDSLYATHQINQNLVLIDIDDSGDYILVAYDTTIEVRSFPDFELISSIILDTDFYRRINSVSFLHNSTDFYYTRIYRSGNLPILGEMFFNETNGITEGLSFSLDQHSYKIIPVQTGKYLILTGNNGISSFRFFDLNLKKIAFAYSKLEGMTHDVIFHPEDPEIVYRVISNGIQEWTFRKNWFQN